MKNVSILSILILSVFILTGCGETHEDHIKEPLMSESTSKPTEDTQTQEKTLNDLMVIFSDKIDAYIANGKKDLKALEDMHLAFVPILRWESFKGDENYNKDALAVGLIVHELEEVEGEEYSALLNTLKPAHIEFQKKYGN